MIRIGTAGWAVPAAVAADFPASGSHLQRYARRFNATEINSTFKHAHRSATFVRWAESTPFDFRFAAKLPHAITHQRRLQGSSELVAAFLDSLAPLGSRLGPLLVQLPASVAFDDAIAPAFFADLRRRFAGSVVLEARHASWFDGAAMSVLVAHRVGTVAADPARVADAAAPGGWLGDADQRGTAYYRWHGAPRVYYSSYPAEWIATQAREVAAMHARCDCWCVFDNTASGAAAANALAFSAACSSSDPSASCGGSGGS